MFNDNLEDIGIYFRYTVTVHPSLEAAGRSLKQQATSTEQKERESARAYMLACFCSARLLYSNNSGPSAQGTVFPALGWIFPYQLTQLRHSSTNMPTDQPKVETLSLRLSGTVILGYLELPIKGN